MIIMDLDPGEDVAWTAVIAAANEVRDRLDGAGPRRLRQDLGRQGPACRGAGEAESRMAGGQGLHQSDRGRDGRRQPRPLRRDHHQGEAARQDPGRLSAQPARHDRRRRLFDPRPARRAGLDAAWPGTSSGPKSGPAYFTVVNAPDAPRLACAGSVGGFPRQRGADRGAKGREAGRASASRPAHERLLRLAFRGDAPAQRVHDVDDIAWRLGSALRLRLGRLRPSSSPR